MGHGNPANGQIDGDVLSCHKLHGGGRPGPWTEATALEVAEVQEWAEIEPSREWSAPSRVKCAY
ncbi:MAG: hypothetical protein ACI9KE_003758 [Polyangiales bacterium]|jgi:hypothetical protein